MFSSPASTTCIILKDRNSLPAPQKDYAAAFASLQSSYGANGLAPVIPASLPVTSKKFDSSQPRRAGRFNMWCSKKEAPEGGLQPSSSTKKKGFKTAFAAFRASCSFGGTSFTESRWNY